MYTSSRCCCFIYEPLNHDTIDWHSLIDSSAKIKEQPVVIKILCVEKLLLRRGAVQYYHYIGTFKHKSLDGEWGDNLLFTSKRWIHNGKANQSTFYFLQIY